MKSALLARAAMLSVTLVAALSLPVLSPRAVAQNAATPAKATLTSTKHRFAVWFPGKARTGSRPFALPTGTRQVEFFFLPPNPISYVVVPLPLSASVLKLSDKEFFDSVQQGVLLQARATTKSSRTLTIGGRRVREINFGFNTPDKRAFTGRMRIMREGTRSYQVSALGQTKAFAPNRAQIDKVFNSFRTLR